MPRTNKPRPRQKRQPFVIEFSLGSGRRRMELSTPTLVVAGVVAIAAGLLAPCAAAYLAFRDDMLAELVDRQTQMHYTYEDRLAALRLRLDQATSRQFLDQGDVESKVQTLVTRQAKLETRAALVARLVEGVSVRDAGPVPVSGQRRPPATTAGLPAGASAYAPAHDERPEPFAGFDKPQPEGLELRLRRDDDAPPRPAERGGASAGLETPNESSRLAAAANLPLQSRLEHLEASLDHAEREQTQRLGRLVEPIRAAAGRLRRAFDVAGLPVERFLTKGRARAEAFAGGPFVPADRLSGDLLFERELTAAQSAATTLEGLRSALPSVPLRKPLAGAPETTSNFGYRTDPFFGRPALHTGVDLRDDYGSPVRATAGGVVVSAGPSGGYGQMVEIDHGSGLATRYAHLSAISVAVGQEVAPGETVGRLGSTGRSTGPHLHYEVRVDGEPVDPTRFLRAASTLAESR
ncbi:M23 family metallopeptidase [Methylosinus sp. H3A]|uniref:M23 family metallopeptidase n=1 Tax=Methylosinus sp. H3A TaxID=2785786 RepID=UPI0018C2BEE4|nr:M23 family metallopeptidase [Methylosinus sp. H3A]MBG0810015.1 M23 family metallopeptidase [Methylosinus sp. H3A]